MSSLIRPNRLEVSDRFPVLGFTIRADASPAWCEVAVATDPQLFRADQQAQRTAGTFFSTRAGGPLLVERGEAVYLIPTEVLGRFVGHDRLYYALSIFPDAARTSSQISALPNEQSPWIDIKMLTGRSLRRAPVARNGVGGPDALAWAGDTVRPGTQPVVAPAPPATNGSAPTMPTNGMAPAAGPSVAAQSSYARPFGGEYDDGYGQALWARMHEVEDDGDSSGIDEPIPDDTPVASQSLAYSRAMTGPQYPQASRFEAAASVNYRSPAEARTINRVVIHITDGGSRIAGTIGWFQNPNQRNSKDEPIHVSAHYVIGQDGEVVQMVRHEDIAWHAGSANRDSIGIEHVANTRGLLPTDAQYCASAALVRWLCDQYGIALDRDHIQGHAEADTRTTHRACPNAVWDWEYFMGMVVSGACYPRQIAAAQGARPMLRRALAAPLSSDIPLDPGSGGQSIGLAALAISDIILSTTSAAVSDIIRRATSAPVSHLLSAWLQEGLKRLGGFTNLVALLYKYSLGCNTLVIYFSNRRCGKARGCYRAACGLCR